MDLGIAGRRAVVTGAGKGIGAAIARSLALEGVAVSILDVDAAAAEATAGALTAGGCAAEARALDVTDRAAVQRV
ncbi:MAG: SDR family NAD(P)-dependent oxidoreductase, partial [Azospirillaceae bacterium]